MQTRIARTFIVIMVLQQFSAGWFFGTYVLYLQDKGLSLLAANILNTAFMLVNFLVDVPTGSWADRFGQKKVFIWGLIVWGLSNILYGVGQNFWHFLGAETVGAIGAALMSGTLDSWLRNTSGEVVSHKALSRSGVLSSLATIPSAVLGAYIGEVAGREWPWLLAGATDAIAVVVAYSLLKRLPDSVGSSIEVRKSAPMTSVVRTSLMNKNLRFTLVITFVSSAAYMAFNMFWSPIMNTYSGSAGWLGLVWIGVAVAVSTGSYLARDAKWLNGRGISVFLLITGVPMLIAAVSGNIIPILIGFLIHEVGRGGVPVLIFTYSQRHIEDDVRSISNSVRSSTKTLGAAVGLAISGGLSEYFQPLHIWGISAFALIVVALYALRRKE